MPLEQNKKKALLPRFRQEVLRDSEKTCTFAPEITIILNEKKDIQHITGDIGMHPGPASKRAPE